jgi:manganese transport protein
MKEFTIKIWVKVLAWLSAAIIVYLNIQLVTQQIHEWIKDAGGNVILVYALVIPVALGCLGLLTYVFVHPFLPKSLKETKQLPHGHAEPILEDGLVHYKHIGIAIDFFGNDQKIIQNALALGGKSAEYTFIHIVESAAARYLGEDTRDHETQLDNSNLTYYKKRLEEMEYKASVQIGFGTPAVEMTKIIAAQNIDLLVMGAHGHKGFKDLAFGSTVDALRHRIKIPVLVVN